MWPSIRPRGFTLLELLVVMVLLALLASLALPSYRDYQRNGYRSAAIADLGRCAQALERFRVTKLTYVNGQLAMLCGSQSPRQGEARYTLTLSGLSATDYVLLASPQGAQAEDGALRLQASGVRHWDRNNNGRFEENEASWQF